jgi:hypothetical protein|tara:strand:+ start:246 stop:590 length:345 start_codon:yes stop_codon:yes gene_type:complete
VSGLSILPLVSARNLELKLNTVSNLKDSGNELIVNYPASYQSLAQSILIDNQDTANAVTLRINRGVNSISIGPSDFRAFNDAWIEQINLTGPSTNTQVTSQVAPLRQVIGGVTN